MLTKNHLQKPPLVLVVDDFEINRDALGIILEEEGYEVIYAEDGLEAMELVRDHEMDLSVMLLDLIMPNMSGFEVLKVMRADEDLRRIPIIVLTAEKNAELEALELGASDFITKPFDLPEVILARVGRIIELSEGRQLISAAEYDRLTMLYNKNFFFEYAERIYQHRLDPRMDAVVINIEQFHNVNALNGRDFGDLVLAEVGSEIRAFLAGTEGIASRFEADRFDIYCAHQDSYEPLLDRLQKHVNEFSPSVAIRLRMGVCEWIEGVEPVVLFDRAHTACNLVRGNYQAPLMRYDNQMRDRELRDQRLLNDLQSAIDQRQLTVYYQPKYNVQVNPPRLSSAEALVRWIHPELGFISPGDFVPLFEGNGLISAVDGFVWREAARQIAEWHEKYGIMLPVSVNLSRADVFDPTLEATLVSLVEDNHLDFSSIKLEVTESAYTDNATKLLDVIARLRAHGFEIEMDDFGSGYSSLNMLSDMPIDVLKMDMKFVRKIEESATDRKLVELIIDIAKYLDLTVVAEGVETEGQMQLLHDHRCDLIQGYYFSRPLPPAEFEKLIEKDIAQRKDA